jgi:CTP synthase
MKNNSSRRKNKNPKYIFIVGGVMSGVGKGIATASIGNILTSMNYKINLVKVDPYLNVDAGTMNPTEHGEVFVLDCGLETDQDMGNYERFLNQDASKYSYMTSGMIYRDVIERERNLGYGGKCVEAIPHIRDEIINRFKMSAHESDADISIIEIGGTIGDYQNIMFLEAARVMKVTHPENVIFMMVSFLPVPGNLGEMKTRPTQNAVRQLNSYGIHADFIIARSHVALDEKRKEKLAITCNIQNNHIISAPDISSVYDVPLNFEKDKIGEMVAKSLKLKNRKSDLSKWKQFVKSRENTKNKIKIAIVGKYFDTGNFVLADSYLSVIEAIKYSAFKEGLKPEITWINSKIFDKDQSQVKTLKNYDGVIVPGGFGESGIEGKLAAIKYARENKIPYLGLCYGMQLLVIEYARNVSKIPDAHTAEINPNAKNLIIDIMPDQKKKLLKNNYGGSMRLGEYPAILKEKTIAHKSYGTNKISERHRHRYEVNPEYIKQLENDGLIFSGTSPDGLLMEIAELSTKTHPFMLGTQFHPEFKARPLSPHPLFTAFVKAIKK